MSLRFPMSTPRTKEEYMYRDIYKPEWKETKLMAPTKTKILGQQAIVITGGGVHPCVGSQCDDS